MDIYSFDLLEVLHMASNAWDNVTAEMIKNCWNHADIQRNPIILHIPLTAAQKGWNIIHTFTDLSSSMTLPQAEDSLKEIFGDQYNDIDWRPVLKVVTETEPDKDVHSLIKNLRQKSHSTNQPFVPTEYTHVAMEVTSAIKELEQQKRIFEGIPNTDSFIEPEAEKEVEIMPVHTDDELVAEVGMTSGNQPDRRHHDIGDKRANHTAEGCSDDDADGHVEHVASQGELAEFS